MTDFHTGLALGAAAGLVLGWAFTLTIFLGWFRDSVGDDGDEDERKGS